MGTSDISFQELSIFLWRAEKKNAASKENQMAGFQVCENICSQTSGRNELKAVKSWGQSICRGPMFVWSTASLSSRSCCHLLYFVSGLCWYFVCGHYRTLLSERFQCTTNVPMSDGSQPLPTFLFLRRLPKSWIHTHTHKKRTKNNTQKATIIICISWNLY